MRKALLLIGLISLGTLSLNPGKTAQVQVADQRLALAKQAVRAMIGEQRLLQVFEKMTTDAMSSRFSSDPKLKELEGRYPGVTAKVVKAASAVIVDQIGAKFDAALDTGAVELAKECSAEELGKITDFFRSPVGSRWLDLAVGSIPTNLTSNTHVPGKTGAGITAATQTMTAAEKKELERFERSPLGQKVATIMPRLRAATMEVFRQPRAGIGEEMQAAIQAAINSYVSRGPGV